MTPKTLKALKASIAKWERNAVAKTPGEYLVSSEDCPLCNLFFDGECEGCPVFERTMFIWCSCTPYDAAASARRAWENGKTDAAPAHEAARKEVEFLKSLLPGGQS